MSHAIGRRILAILFATAVTACTSAPPPPSVGQPAMAPYQDSKGWTVFTPSSDSRIVYVSSSEGDDDSGQVYQAGDPAVGEDPRRPGNVKAFASFDAAFEQTRAGYPDWVLLKRGDTFHGAVAVRNGRTEAEPFVLASYGEAGEMPVVKAGSQRALEVCCESFNDIAVQGIDFYAHTRDFDSPDFKSTKGTSGLWVVVNEGYRGTGLLIEGCKFRFFTGNYIQTNGRLNNVVFRRNLVTDSYSTAGDSQGLYGRELRNVLVEENIFDHNGWYRQQQTDRLDNREGGQATMFNHNTYFQDSHDVLFKHNIFVRPASIGSKWTANDGAASTTNITIVDNLYIDGEIGISMGGNKSDPLRFRNITVADNVLLDIGHSQPTGRDFAWYLDVRDWDGGTIKGNTFVHPGSNTTNNIWAIELSGRSRNVTIADNLIYGFGNGWALSVEEDVELENIRVADNRFQAHSDLRHFIKAKDTVRGITFANNRYASGAGGSARKFHIDGESMTLPRWQRHSGDQGSQTALASNLEPRDLIAQYQAAVGRSASVEQFIEALRAQGYHDWDAAYTADVINEWIRARLTTPDAPSTASRTSAD